MFAVTVSFKIDPPKGPEFMALMRANATTSLRQEVGCLRFDICRDASNLDTIFLYEVYADRAAFDMHLHSAHFLSFDQSVADMILSKDVKTYDEVWV